MFWLSVSSALAYSRCSSFGGANSCSSREVRLVSPEQTQRPFLDDARSAAWLTGAWADAINLLARRVAAAAPLSGAAALPPRSITSSSGKRRADTNSETSVLAGTQLHSNSMHTTAAAAAPAAAATQRHSELSSSSSGKRRADTNSETSVLAHPPQPYSSGSFPVSSFISISLSLGLPSLSFRLLHSLLSLSFLI
jgi:hypothetical protein